MVRTLCYYLIIRLDKFVIFIWNDVISLNATIVSQYIAAEKDLESESDSLPEAEKEVIYEKEDAATRAFWRWNAPLD